MASSTSLAGQVTPAEHPDQVPPPPMLIRDDPKAADLARRRLASPSRLHRIVSPLNFRSKLSKRSSKNTASDAQERDAETPNADEREQQITTTSAFHYVPITLDGSPTQDGDETQDRYEWAILYENQRGMTVFSIPYYSSQSLLPTDPAAFTLPTPSRRRSEQPPITLQTYPLPDGTWRWVSRTWMVDMRSESGIVQHDGFEYNWMFRRHHWRSQVGFMSAGGWVRRRRWVRLMMRPGKKPQEGSQTSSPSISTGSSSYLRRTIASSSQSSTFDVNVDNVWQGTDPEEDWKRCRALMLHYGRDGRNIDIWKIWLGYYHPAYRQQFQSMDGSDDKGKGKQKQSSEDDEPLSSPSLEPDAASHQSSTPPPREYISPVLRKHGHHLLRLFIYPDSRVQILKLLGRAGLLPELGINIGSKFSTSEIDFWSYTSGLEKELERLVIR